MSSWTTLTFDGSDPALLLANAKRGMQGLWPLQWTAPQKKKCYAPVPHTQTTPDGTFSCLTIDADYKARWKAQYAQMKPLIQAGALIGVFLGDEQMWLACHTHTVR